MTPYEVIKESLEKIKIPVMMAFNGAGIEENEAEMQFRVITPMLQEVLKSSQLSLLLSVKEVVEQMAETKFEGYFNGKKIILVKDLQSILEEEIEKVKNI